MNESCPFEQAARAAQCTGCVEKHGSLSPCVTAWLNSRLGESVPRAQMIEFVSFDRADLKKAA